MKIHDVVLVTLGLLIPLATVRGQSGVRAEENTYGLVSTGVRSPVPHGYYRLTFQVFSKYTEEVRPLTDPNYFGAYRTFGSIALSSSSFGSVTGKEKRFDLRGLNEFLRTTSEGALTGASEKRALTEPDIGMPIPNMGEHVEPAPSHGYAAHLSMKGDSLTGDGRVNVSIAYDPQPIGGIIALRVDLIPVYSGVVIGTLPLASATYASAVDAFDADQICALALTLIESLEQKYAPVQSRLSLQGGGVPLGRSSRLVPLKPH